MKRFFKLLSQGMAICFFFGVWAFMASTAFDPGVAQLMHGLFFTIGWGAVYFLDIFLLVRTVIRFHALTLNNDGTLGREALPKATAFP
jgi:hypothetical protein